jgi:hypothetical protein
LQHWGEPGATCHQPGGGKGQEDSQRKWIPYFGREIIKQLTSRMCPFLRMSTVLQIAIDKILRCHYFASGQIISRAACSIAVITCTLETIADQVSSVMELDASDIWKGGKSRNRVAARSLLCFWAVRELGISMTELSRRLDFSLSGVSQTVIRGEKLAEENGFKLLEQKL